MTAHFRASIFRLFRLPLSTVWKSSRTGHQPYMDQMPSVVSPTSSCAGTLMAFGHPRESLAQPKGEISSINMAWSTVRGVIVEAACGDSVLTLLLCAVCVVDIKKKNTT